MKIKKWEIALFIAIILSIFVGAASAERSELSENLIRLHVVANSDSDEDQNLKLAVRDAVLMKVSGLLDGCSDKALAEKIITGNTDILALCAEDVVRERGESYPVTAAIKQEVFPTVQYDTFALPAGKYTSLRVIIGEGGGHNWWCVVFPPLCLAAAEDIESLEDSGISAETLKVISEDSEEYVVKFKLLEMFSKLSLWLESVNAYESVIPEDGFFYGI